MKHAETVRPATETYRATADARLAAALGAAAPFTIDVRFMGGFSPRQMDLFRAAADRWVKVIVGDLPDVVVEGELVDDVLILASAVRFDGPQGMLGLAGPTWLRPATGNPADLLPAKGIMKLDRVDVARLEAAGTLEGLIAHEMGHVLGVGTIWDDKGLIDVTDPGNPVFMGANAMREYGVLRGTGPIPVPIENVGGEGTQGLHWRETIFGTELMTGNHDPGPNANSRVTVASLLDCGYGADLRHADPFTLASPRALAEAGRAIDRVAQSNGGCFLPTTPARLPVESLR